MTFMPKFGRDTLRDVDVKHVSFYLEKDWDTTCIVQEKKACLVIDSTE